MKDLKSLLVFVLLVVIAGCATHAQINVPVIEKVNSDKWDGKNFSYEIFYSQPEPGAFSAGEQQNLKPLSEAKLSVGAARVLSNFPKFLADILPMNVTVTDQESADYDLIVEIIAHHKAGPAYANYEMGKNIAKSFISLGMAADEYDIVADFDVTYTLRTKAKESFRKHFAVKDSVDHERGAVEFKNNTYEYAAELLKKHIYLSTSEFMAEASKQL